MIPTKQLLKGEVQKPSASQERKKKMSMALKYLRKYGAKLRVLNIAQHIGKPKKEEEPESNPQDIV
jgi:hypothetical protein